MADINELQDTTIKLKKEVLDIKEYIYDEGVNKSELSSSISQITDTITDIKNDLSNYVTQDSLENSLNSLNIIDTYDKKEIDTRISNLNFVTPEYLHSLSYLTKSSLTGYLTSAMAESLYVKKDDNNYVKDYELTSTLQDYAKLSDVPDVTNLLSNIELKNYYTKTEVDKLIPSLKGYVKKYEMYAYGENDIMDMVDEKIAQIEIPEVNLEGYATIADVNISLKNYVKKTDIPTDFSVYATISQVKEIKDRLQNLATTEDVLGVYENLNRYYTSNDVDNNFIKKSDISDYLPDLSPYLKVSTLNSLYSKTEIDTLLKSYLTISAGDKRYLLKTDYNDIDTSNFLTQSDLSKYVTVDTLNTKLSSFTPSNSVTQKDLDVLSNNFTNTLSKYAKLSNVYTRDYILKNYYNIEQLEDNVYTKKEADNTFLKQTDASKTYLTKVDAIANYLTKDDYRGIKSAMLLTDTYRDDPETFYAVLEKGGLNDGFYIVNNSTFVVKNNEVFSINQSGSYSIEDIDSMNLASKDWVDENYKPLNWIMDTGGNY
jgi:hypothetical protein